MVSLISCSFKEHILVHLFYVVELSGFGAAGERGDKFQIWRYNWVFTLNLSVWNIRIFRVI